VGLPEPSEAEQALEDLVRELESSDYRDSAGVRADRTSAFACAKALIEPKRALARAPWRRR
jgi:hypothetical protein